MILVNAMPSGVVCAGRGMFMLPERYARQVCAVQLYGMSHHVFTRGNAKLSPCLVSVCVRVLTHIMCLYIAIVLRVFPVHGTFSSEALWAFPHTRALSSKQV